MPVFVGSAECTIDAKGRLAIPAKYRNRWDPTRDGLSWFCVLWPDGTLRLYTEAVFNRLSDALEDTLMPDEDRVKIDRLFFSQAEELNLDSAGRLMLPRKHLQRAALPNEVTIIGAKNRLEVHPRETWEQTVDAEHASLPELVRRMEGSKRERGE